MVTAQGQAVVVVLAADSEASVGGAPVSAEDVSHGDVEGVAAVSSKEMDVLVAQPALRGRATEPHSVLGPAPGKVHLAATTQTDNENR